MNDINIKDITFAGIVFTSDSMQVYEKYKFYKLKLKAVSPWRIIETEVKIRITDTKKDNSGNCMYAALYRELSKIQAYALIEIADCFKKKQTIRQTTLPTIISAYIQPLKDT